MGLVRRVLALVSIVVAILAYLKFSSDPGVFKSTEKHQTASPVMDKERMSRLPTYFFSHGGVSSSVPIVTVVP
jgi:hypothetical protein